MPLTNRLELWRRAEVRLARAGSDRVPDRAIATVVDADLASSHGGLVALAQCPGFLRDLGASAGFDVERIEDLRIAVDELAAAALATAEPNAALLVELRPSDGTIHIAGRVAGSGPVELDAVADQVVRAVCERAEIEADDGVIRFSCTLRSARR